MHPQSSTRTKLRHITVVPRMQGLKWAMAGRNKEKLEDVRASLANPGQNLSDVKLVHADINDPVSLGALAASASVVITMVGPYALYGRPVIQVPLLTPHNCCSLSLLATLGVVAFLAGMHAHRCP